MSHVNLEEDSYFLKFFAANSKREMALCPAGRGNLRIMLAPIGDNPNRSFSENPLTISPNNLGDPRYANWHVIELNIAEQKTLAHYINEKIANAESRRREDRTRKIS